MIIHSTENSTICRALVHYKVSLLPLGVALFPSDFVARRSIVPDKLPPCSASEEKMSHAQEQELTLQCTSQVPKK